MIQVYLLKGQQHSMESYIGFIPAKDLVKLATQVELRVEQEAQRLINPKRLEEISNFVRTKDGSLSTSVVIGTKDDRIQVKHLKKNLYYIEFPETKEEFEEYKDAFDIMDGQHRLFAFLAEYIKLPDDERYDISFNMYIKPTLEERRLIFKNTNEKQEKVAPNLLMWFREKLNLLSGKEKTYHPVVSLLNSEARSPLKGRIIMGAEKITGGYKAQQIISILDKVNIKHISSNKEGLDKNKMFDLISIYLTGWEQAVGAKIANRPNNLGAFSKISGLRFMLLLLPVFYEQAVKEHSKITEQYICKKIKEITSLRGIISADIFDKESDYYQELGLNPFSAETPTTKLAQDWIQLMKSREESSFDPLA